MFLIRPVTLKTEFEMSGILNEIRKEAADAAKQKCPKCTHELTVEKMPFFTVELCENCFDYSKIIDAKDCCNLSKYQYVRLVTTGGYVQVKEQCINCGNVKPSAIGGFSKEQKDTLPLLDASLRELRYQVIQAQYSEARHKINEGRQKRYTESLQERKDAWLSEYTKYLDSPEWRHKRELVLKRDEYLCQCCLKNYATQVHHKSYEFEDLSGSIPAFDLVAVCGPCHERIEEMKRNNRKSNNP